jgi:hypothetical protein
MARPLRAEPTTRERFARVFAGEPVDRVPFLDIMGCWPASLARWKQEGLPQDATPETVRAMMGFEGCLGYYLPIQGYVWPEFEPEVLAEDGNGILRRNRWGSIERNSKDSEMLPITISGPVRDRATWDAIRARLDPDTPGRLPENWAEICREARASDQPVFAGELPLGFFGTPRELLGFERQTLLFYDDPDLMHAILDALCDLWIGLFTRVQREVALDYFYIWEDMCFKTGPLIGPELFREFLLPRYQRLTAALRRNGCRHILVDSDGDERALTPLWIEGGVDIVFPWETQFGLDITAVRRRYPRLGMMGGIDKFALAHGRAAIDRELAKIPFMLTQGRYIPGLDHGVPPDVAWDDYRYYCDGLRDLIWKYPPDATLPQE